MLDLMVMSTVERLAALIRVLLSKLTSRGFFNLSPQSLWLKGKNIWICLISDDENGRLAVWYRFRDDSFDFHVFILDGTRASAANVCAVSREESTFVQQKISSILKVNFAPGDMPRKGRDEL